VIERRYARLRYASGRVLEGTAVRYGDVGRASWAGRERIEPGAFGDVARSDVLLNDMHVRARPLARTGGGGLVLTDTREALTMRAELPDTRRASDTLALVRAGVLRGLSVEFRALREHMEGGVRVVTGAALEGLGVVDRPAYPASTVEARQRPERTRVTGRVRLGEPLACRCRKNCDSVVIERTALDAALAEAEALERDITAFLSGHFDAPLASMSAGTLRLTRSGDVLNVAISQLVDTGSVRDFLAGLVAARFTFRPWFPDDASEFRVEGTTAIFERADLRAVEIVPLVGPLYGLEELTVHAEPDVPPPPPPAQRRLLAWL